MAKAPEGPTERPANRRLQLRAGSKRRVDIGLRPPQQLSHGQVRVADGSRPARVEADRPGLIRVQGPEHAFVELGQRARARGLDRELRPRVLGFPLPDYGEGETADQRRDDRDAGDDGGAS